MKKRLPDEYEKFRVDHDMYVRQSLGDIQGAFAIRRKNKRLIVLSGSGTAPGCADGWDHVSVSLKHRLPTWTEMCFIKQIFFKPEELVVQFHPPESKYINMHQHVLHLWLPWDQAIKLPPVMMV